LYGFFQAITPCRAPNSWEGVPTLLVPPYLAWPRARIAHSPWSKKPSANSHCHFFKSVASACAIKNAKKNFKFFGQLGGDILKANKSSGG
jgi:hypothetical protein